MKTNEKSRPPPVFANRRRADRRQPAGRPDLASPEGGLKPLPEPRPPDRRLAPSVWPEGDFRVDPEA